MTNVYFISKEEIKRRRDIRQLKMQLQPLNEDLLQAMAGVTIPNLEEKKAEFKRIHGDIRELEGKSRER
ncbi:MAG: hypothetical protein ACLSUU_03090 [Christensenellales bacterium]|jgi:hypothetical protein